MKIKEQSIRKQILLANIKVTDPDKVIECINHLCPKVSGLCYFDNEMGELKSKDKKYEFYFDPYHRVIEINELKPRI